MLGARIVSVGSALLLATLLAACGGGGAGSSLPPLAGNSASSLPAASAMNTATSYVVYAATVSSTTRVGLGILNPDGSSSPPSTNVPWSLVTTGAVVTYPDGSIQVTDALGAFDAAQSSWARANSAALATNPRANPEVSIRLLGSSAQTPLITTVQAYAGATGSMVTASRMRANGARRFVADGQDSNDNLGSVTLLPRGFAVFDNAVQTLTLVGTDENALPFDLSTSSIAWSVKGCNGGAAAGSITAFAQVPYKATYTPPVSGTATCPDIVTAMVTLTDPISHHTSSFSSTANAFYQDPLSGVAITGTLKNSTNTPVSNGLVFFYGNGYQAYRGNAVALTDANGQFSFTLPAFRTTVMVGGNLQSAGALPSSASYYTLSPSSVSTGANGTSIPAATYTEGVAYANPYLPLPSLDLLIKDAYQIWSAQASDFPFNRPDASGNYPTCSVDAIINQIAGSTNCTSVAATGDPSVDPTGDVMAGWSVVNVSANSWIFQEPSSIDNGRYVLQISLAPSTPTPAFLHGSDQNKTLACSNGAKCWNFTEFYLDNGFPAAITSPITSRSGIVSGGPAGTMLAGDGSFSEQNTVGGSFAAQYVYNHYNLGHTILGQPWIAESILFTYINPASPAACISYVRYDQNDGIVLSAITQRAANGPGFTFYSTANRYIYNGSGEADTSLAGAQLSYTITGNYNLGGNYVQTALVAVTQSADRSTKGTNIALIFNNVSSCGVSFPAPISGIAHICGTVFSPNYNGVVHGDFSFQPPPYWGGWNSGSPIAVFSSDLNQQVNVKVDSGFDADTQTGIVSQAFKL